VKRGWSILFLVAASIAFARDHRGNMAAPFTLHWNQGKCLSCQTASGLGRIQVISRQEAWAVGFRYPPPGYPGAGDFVAVHTKDAGLTWTEVSETRMHAGDVDGPPAISFLDAARGWIASWDPADEAKVLHTKDGGRHWQVVSDEPLQQMIFFDVNRGYGSEVTNFLRTSDGGRHWSESQIPHVRFIDRMFFLTPDMGWLAGTDGQNAWVFRTENGGQSWEWSKITLPTEVARVADVFFLDHNLGWLITWHYNDEGTFLYFTRDGGRNWAPEADQSFQGKGKWAGVVRFLSEKLGFVFESGEDNNLLYTLDGGSHWSKEALPQFVSDCQIFEGDLLCSSGTKGAAFNFLTLHLK